MSRHTSPRPPLRLPLLLAHAGKSLWRGLLPIALLNSLPSLPTLLALTVNGEVSQTPTLADLVALPIAVILLVFAQGATIAGTHRLLQGADFDLLASARQTWLRLPTLLGTAFLSGILVLLGLAALVVPGLMAIALLYLALPACMIERTDMVESLERSGQLTQGYRWSVLGLFILTLLPTIGLGAITGDLASAPATVIQVLGQEAGMVLFGTLSAVTAAAAFERLREIQGIPEAARPLPEWASGKT
ncbi:hypothetical protein FZC33_10710 [Labrys sp. KNU-23]|uniref:hypothetical protein n=1 Tax=Labrys sp. KNU-23 TaxID=2789216 RepID=UPI0011EE46C6|nr:hypothetical protein [Labrys sp. KNU-23]QEN86768.1 hypothetical protein FZC33_10710 [Labrys sp. KNU-23]